MPQKYDQYGNPIADNKPADQLATTNPTGQNTNTALSTAAMSGSGAPAPANVNAGNTAVLSKAQTDVLNQPGKSDLQSATEQSTMNWLKNPMGDYNAQTVKQAGLEKAQQDWGSAFEGMRQQYGAQSGSGLLQKNMLENALKHNVEQAQLGAQYDTDAYNKYVDSMARSIAAGQAGTKQAEDIFSQRLGNLGTVRGMAEGEAGRASTEKIATQNVEAEKDVAQMRIDADKAMQAADQKWKTGERVSAQDYEAYQKELDRRQAEALQKNDIASQEKIAQQRIDAELNMQTQGFNQQEKMAYLNAKLDEAKANNDVERQKAIIGYQADRDMEKMTAQFGFEAAQKDLDRKLQAALQNNDIVAAQKLQDTRLAWQAKEAILDRDLEKTKIALTERGLDAQEFENNYNRLVEQEKMGIIPAGSAANYINKNVSGLNLQISDPNTEEAVRTALQAQYKAEQYKWALSHRNPSEGLVDENGELTARGLQQFTEFYNTSAYQEPGAIDSAVKAQEAATRAVNDPKEYERVASQAQEWKPDFSYDTGGFFGADTRSFKNPPAKDSIVKIGGIAYLVVSEPRMNKKGQDAQVISVRNLKTGTMENMSIIGGANGAPMRLAGLSGNTQYPHEVI